MLIQLSEIENYLDYVNNKYSYLSKIKFYYNDY